MPLVAPGAPEAQGTPADPLGRVELKRWEMPRPERPPAGGDPGIPPLALSSG